MSTDAGHHPGSWDLVERGSFVLGACRACGYSSPARRARQSVYADLRAHEVLCAATGSDSEGVPDDPREVPGAPADARADTPAGTASGRERLSAQGRS